MGVITSVPCIFSFISGTISPMLYEYAGELEGGGLWKTFMLGAFINLLSVFMVVLLVYIQKIGFNKDKENL